MSWVVRWRDKDYDVDPGDLDGWELSQIKQKVGLTYKALLIGVGELDADAIRALFWIVDRRDQPDLQFSDYRGPSINTIMPHMAAYAAMMEAVGKLVPDVPDTATTETTGSDGSASSMDGATLTDIEL